MELQLVNDKQAKTLKELGFPTKWTYNKNIPNTFQLGDRIHGFAYHYCPTLELVAKWLRDEKNISLEPYRTAAGWICMIVDIPSGTDRYQVGYDDDAGDDKSSGQFTTFEKALSAGIDKAIEMLKNKNSHDINRI